MTYPVLRRSADIASTGTSAQGVTVEAGRADVPRSDRLASELVSKPSGRSAALRGTTLPSDATSVVARLQVRGALLLFRRRRRRRSARPARAGAERRR
jgi:hypothetical protein